MNETSHLPEMRRLDVNSRHRLLPYLLLWASLEGQVGRLVEGEAL
jgi:hypothetical protein